MQVKQANPEICRHILLHLNLYCVAFYTKPCWVCIHITQFPHELKENRVFLGVRNSKLHWASPSILAIDRVQHWHQKATPLSKSSHAQQSRPLRGACFTQCLRHCARAIAL